MNIAYITNYNASDIHNWSGLGYYISKALIDQNATLDFINQQEKSVGLMLNTKKVIYKIMGKDLDLSREPSVVRKISLMTGSQIKPNTDIVFSPSSIPIALLETKKPKVFYTDATFAGMIGFYEGFSKINPEAIKKANYLEQTALDSAKLVIYSSDWAANTAIKLYGASPEKIKVVPFGANIICNRSLSDIKQISSNRSRDECNLLYIGVDWERKGGDVAVEITQQLNNMGLKTRLHLVGNNSIPIKVLPHFVTNHGFISKSAPDGKKKLDKLFSECHFLLLPTKADCTPVVFSEANSFGLPVITTDVGGIPSIISADVNGITFPLGTDLAEWSHYICTVFSNPSRYEELCLSSFAEYQNRLNWEKAGKTIIGYLKDL
jgi:glycosyltransferase involved in cell wall biosynthesis